MSPQRSYANRAVPVQQATERVVIHPTIVLVGSGRSRRRFELQRLLEEPLTVPLGTMHISPVMRFTSEPTSEPEETAPQYPAEVSHLHAYALQQIVTPAQRHAFDPKPTPPRVAPRLAEVHDEAATAPARPSRHARQPPRPAPQPWAARAAAARVLTRRAASLQPSDAGQLLQPSAAGRSAEHWLTRAGVLPPATARRVAPPPPASRTAAPAPTHRPARPRLSPAHIPWQPDARPSRDLSRTARIHHRGTWTWPIALSLCSMLLAYAITARWLSRAALEHRNQPGVAACR